MTGSAPRQIEVKQGDWQHLQGEGQLFTIGFSTCIALSMYNRRDNQGFLGHFDIPSFQSGNANKMVNEAQRNFLSPEDSQIWIGGGALLDPRAETAQATQVDRDSDITEETVGIANDETERFREGILHLVDDLVGEGAALSTFWLRGAVYLNYTLDVATGRQTATISND